jgi:LysM repeat protein
MGIDIVGSSQVGGSSSWGTYSEAANAAAIGNMAEIARIALQDPNSFGGGNAAPLVNDGSGDVIGGSWSPEPAGNNAIFDGTYSATGGLTVPNSYMPAYSRSLTSATASNGAAKAASAQAATASEADKKADGDAAAAKAAAAAAAAKHPPAAAAKPAAETVTVASGDTLSGIARTHGVSWQNLYAANKGVIGGNPNLIRPGQQLTLP